MQTSCSCRISILQNGSTCCDSSWHVQHRDPATGGVPKELKLHGAVADFFFAISTEGGFNGQRGSVVFLLFWYGMIYRNSSDNTGPLNLEHVICFQWFPLGAFCLVPINCCRMSSNRVDVCQRSKLAAHLISHLTMKCPLECGAWKL